MSPLSKQRGAVRAHRLMQDHSVARPCILSARIWFWATAQGCRWHSLQVATFQSDFYVTCATIIPVFFLAVAVQGTSYQDLLDTLIGVVSKVPVDAPPLRVFWSYVLSTLTNLLGFLVVIVGVAGEVMALYSLYLGREEGLRGVVLAATLILLIAVAAGPVQRAVTVMKLSGTWAPASRHHQSDDDEERADIPDGDGSSA